MKNKVELRTRLYGCKIRLDQCQKEKLSQMAHYDHKMSELKQEMYEIFTEIQIMDDKELEAEFQLLNNCNL